VKHRQPVTRISEQSDRGNAAQGPLGERGGRSQLRVHQTSTVGGRRRIVLQESGCSHPS